MAEQDNGWKVKKEIDLNAILHLAMVCVVVVGLAISAFSWGSKIESRITTVETSQSKDMLYVVSEIKAIRTMRDNDIANLRSDINYVRGSIDRVDSKIDKLIQRP